ncbi:MAG: hypothetical protein M3Y56_03000 [Armatimonadota bacterium]|nr:hypothetical protein [Armatimonadota bacterium]
MEQTRVMSSQSHEVKPSELPPHGWLILATYVLELCAVALGVFCVMFAFTMGLSNMDGQKIPAIYDTFACVLLMAFAGAALIPLAMAVYLATRKNSMDRLAGWAIILLNVGCGVMLGYTALQASYPKIFH